MSDAPGPAAPDELGLPDAEAAAPPRLGPGLQMKEERIRRGRSLRQAHQATRIPTQYLEAIEAEEWGALPAAPFTRGFIASYADYLGMDSAVLLEQSPIGPTAPGAGLEPEPEQVPEGAPRSGSPGGQQRAGLAGGSSLGAWIAALVVAAIVAGAALILLRSGDTEEAPPEQREVAGLAEPRVPAPGSGQVEVDSAPVPDLSGVPRIAALAYARVSGVPYLVIEVADAAPAATVIEQSPPPGAQLEAGDSLLIVVSAGPGAAPEAAEAEAGGAESEDEDSP